MQDKFYEILNNSKNILINCYARIGDAVISSILIDNLSYHFQEKNNKNNIVICSENNSLIFYGKQNLIPLIWPKDKEIILNYSIDIAIFAGPADSKNNFEIFQFLKKQKNKCVFLGLVKNFTEGYGYDVCIYNSLPNIIERCKNNTKIIVGNNTLINPTLIIPPNVEQEILTETGNLERYTKIYINLSAANKRNLKSYISRTIPLNIYVSVIKLIYKKYDNVCFLITAAPWDLHRAKNVVKNLYKIIKNEHIKIIATPTIHHLISIIKISDIVITPETSVVFIASVFNKPIVGIYNSNKKVIEWPPFSEKYSIVLPKIPYLMSSVDPYEICSKIEDYMNCRDKKL